MRDGTFVLPLMLKGGREQGLCCSDEFLCNYICKFLFLGLHGHSVIVRGRCFFRVCQIH